MAEIRRPTADYDNGGLPLYGDVQDSSPSMANARDTSDSTYSSVTATGQMADPGQSHVAGRLFTSWASASGTYTALSLEVHSSVGIGGTGGGEAILQYSTNGGSTWTNVYDVTTNRTDRTDTITLPPSQNLANLQVQAAVLGLPDFVDPGSASITIYDIRTEGTLATGGPVRRILNFD